MSAVIIIELMSSCAVNEYSIITLPETEFISHFFCEYSVPISPNNCKSGTASAYNEPFKIEDWVMSRPISFSENIFNSPNLN